jgi:inorganic triphosphatase YgiF
MDRPTEHVETERKYEVDLGFVLPDLSGVADGVTATAPEVELLAANYYDTADLRLANAKITLRRRTGGHDAGWHLKLPVSAGTRRELQVPLEEGDTIVPSQLTSLVSEWIRGEPLQVVAVLETHRTVRRLIGADGENLAEVADDEVTGRVPGRQEPAAWRELEVELVTGGPEILAAAGSRLTSAGARPSSSASKLSRLLGTDGSDVGRA